MQTQSKLTKRARAVASGEPSELDEAGPSRSSNKAHNTQKLPAPPLNGPPAKRQRPLSHSSAQVERSAVSDEKENRGTSEVVPAVHPKNIEARPRPVKDMANSPFVDLEDGVIDSLFLNKLIRELPPATNGEWKQLTGRYNNGLQVRAPGSRPQRAHELKKDFLAMTKDFAKKSRQPGATGAEYKYALEVMNGLKAAMGQRAAQITMAEIHGSHEANRANEGRDSECDSGHDSEEEYSSQYGSEDGEDDYSSAYCLDDGGQDFDFEHDSEDEEAEYGSESDWNEGSANESKNDEQDTANTYSQASRNSEAALMRWIRQLEIRDVGHRTSIFARNNIKSYKPFTSYQSSALRIDRRTPTLGSAEWNQLAKRYRQEHQRAHGGPESRTWTIHELKAEFMRMKDRYTFLSQRPGELGARYKDWVEVIREIGVKYAAKGRQVKAEMARRKREAEEEAKRKRQAEKAARSRQLEVMRVKKEEEEGGYQANYIPEGYNSMSGSDDGNWDNESDRYAPDEGPHRCSVWCNCSDDKEGEGDSEYGSEEEDRDRGDTPYEMYQRDRDSWRNRENMMWRQIRQLEDQLRNSREAEDRFRRLWQSAEGRVDEMEDQKQFWMMYAMTCR
ncbi:hypothetical protein HDV00_006137 [Rhizophlyctis rosea]|nr:hypothetical protein HDV00_006137 [Rhizophlyctis rosea]